MLKISIAESGCEDIEVVVTDASVSTDTRSLIREQYPWVHWVSRPRGGPAENRNNGVRAARGHWVFFTDDDCLPEAGWIGGFLEAINANAATQVFEGRTNMDREPTRLDEEAPFNPGGGYLWACNMAICRSLFLGMGGFCEEFRIAGSEDSDLRIRLRKAHQPIVFVPKAVVCHPLRRSKGLAFQLAVGRAHLLLVRRHPEILGSAPWSTAILNMGRMLLMTLREAVRMRFRGFGFALGRLAIHTYFVVVAILRRPRATLQPAVRRR
jgi:GT2 family glycosyltransferase